VSNTFVYENASERPRIDKEVLNLYNSAQGIAARLINDESSTESIRAAAQRALLGGTDKSFNPLYAFYERSKIMGTIQDDGEKDTIAAFDETFRERLRNRRFCTTKQGKMGIVPSISKVGDTVGFVEHIKSPFVFAARETVSTFWLATRFSSIQTRVTVKKHTQKEESLPKSALLNSFTIAA
jgi:hypothetical protein